MTTLTHKPADPLDVLCNELQAWCTANGLPYIDAEELGMSAHVNDAQRDWLVDFCLRWDAAEREREAVISDLARTERDVALIRRIRADAAALADRDAHRQPGMTATKALAALILTPLTREFLESTDPQALRQARAALDLPT
jgi:hypothetical protein